MTLEQITEIRAHMTTSDRYVWGAETVGRLLDEIEELALELEVEKKRTDKEIGCAYCSLAIERDRYKNRAEALERAIRTQVVGCYSNNLICCICKQASLETMTNQASCVDCKHVEEEDAASLNSEDYFEFDEARFAEEKEEAGE